MVISIHILVQEINLKSPEIVCGWGSAPDPAGGAYDAPPDPLIGFAQALRALGSRALRARHSGALRPRPHQLCKCSKSGANKLNFTRSASEQPQM